MPKVGFVSLGCPKNLVDSEVMMGILARAGYELTPRAGEADVLVVNTCSFIEPAQKESVDSILEMAEYKKFGRAQKLIVAGCMVERFRNDIREQIPEVDAVIGTGEIERILQACEGELRPDDSEKIGGAELPTYLYHDATPRILATPRHTAYIKFNEGCDHPCSFCVIPQPPLRIRDPRSGKSGRRRSARNFAHRPGHHFLRRGPWPARRPGRAARAPRANRRPALGALPLLLSQSHHSAPARYYRGASAPGKISGRSTAARQPQRPRAHEARRERRRVPENAGEGAPRDSRRCHSHVVHRRLPGRN